MNSMEDILNWEKFNTNSKKLSKKLPSKVGLYNRLIFHTKNFFVIAGYGSFVEGYILVISKQNISSFSHLDVNVLKEFKWLKKFLSIKLSETYVKDIAVFEHGMCSCAGGLDHAHLHFMPITKLNSILQFQDIINETIKRRAIGINKIKFGDHYLSNPHDISSIIQFGKGTDYKIIDGKLLNYNDLTNNEKLKIYPDDTEDEVYEGNQYIFFEIFEKDYKFYTLETLGTQFGRELCYNLEICNDKVFSEFCKNNFMNNPNKLIWRWQDYIFDEYILLTIKKLSRINVSKNEEKSVELYEFKNIYE